MIPKMLWRYHDIARTKVRVWREDWVGDMFEVMTTESFNAMRRLFNTVEFEEANDDDED